MTPRPPDNYDTTLRSDGQLSPQASEHPPLPAVPERLPRAVPDARRRFLSETDCHDIARRLAQVAEGGGFTSVWIESTWLGNVRWARNQISSTGEDRNDHIVVERNMRGARGTCVVLNESTDEALVAAARRAERLARLEPETPLYELWPHTQFEPFVAPQIFSEATYNLDAEQRATSARQLAQSAANASMLSAGYIEVSATSLANITSYGFARYFQYTQASYSVTVRDPSGSGSGWAGVDWWDWNKIDGPKLSALALDKCLKSRNPVAIEPGRYTTILEPQAVCDFIGQMTTCTVPSDDYPLLGNEFGVKVIDERLSVSADPMDPALGFQPFEHFANTNDKMNLINAYIYHPITWIENGVTKLPVRRPRNVAYKFYNQKQVIAEEGAIHISVTGATTSVEEMIATTKRGLLVTRFDLVQSLDVDSRLFRGYTRDGLWLIENGKISKAVKNMQFVESISFALNNVDQVGVPQRAFRPMLQGPYSYVDIAPQPAFVPPMKIRDFSFTALADAV